MKLDVYFYWRMRSDEWGTPGWKDYSGSKTVNIIEKTDLLNDVAKNEWWGPQSVSTPNKLIMLPRGSFSVQVETGTYSATLYLKNSDVVYGSTILNPNYIGSVDISLLSTKYGPSTYYLTLDDGNPVSLSPTSNPFTIEFYPALGAPSISITNSPSRSTYSCTELYFSFSYSAKNYDN